MKLSLRFTSIALLLLSGVGFAAPDSSAPPQPASAYRNLKWEDLIPPGWDPAQAIRGMNFDQLDDADPRAIEAFENLRKIWDNAPANAELDGKRVRIPGFLVPLDPVRDGNIREFLLVPYFGACIHTPPPPSNQVIHVISPKPLSKEQQKVLLSAASRYGAILVSGKLEIVNARTSMAASGYRLKADGLAHHFYKGTLDNPTR